MYLVLAVPLKRDVWPLPTMKSPDELPIPMVSNQVCGVASASYAWRQKKVYENRTKIGQQISVFVLMQGLYDALLFCWCRVRTTFCFCTDARLVPRSAFVLMQDLYHVLFLYWCRVRTTFGWNCCRSWNQLLRSLSSVSMAGSFLLTSRQTTRHVMTSKAQSRRRMTLRILSLTSSLSSMSRGRTARISGFAYCQGAGAWPTPMSQRIRTDKLDLKIYVAFQQTYVFYQLLCKKCTSSSTQILDLIY